VIFQLSPFRDGVKKIEKSSQLKMCYNRINIPEIDLNFFNEPLYALTKMHCTFASDIKNKVWFFS